MIKTNEKPNLEEPEIMRRRLMAGKYDPILSASLEEMMLKPKDENEQNLQAHLFATTMEKMYVDKTIQPEVYKMYEELYDAVVNYVTNYGGEEHGN